MIIEGSAIPETIGSVIAAQEIFGFSVNKPILIVEGKDDISVITRYYYHRKKYNQPFKVVTGEDFNTSVSGKKSALQSYHMYKEKFENIFCLVDRDFDFLLNEIETDNNIFYYDFYELENYLYEEVIIRVFLDRYCNCVSKDSFVELINTLKESSNLFFPITIFAYLRELNFRFMYHRDLNEEELKIVVGLAKANLSTILLNSSPEYKTLTPLEKVIKHVDDLLSTVNMSYFDILNESTSKEIAVSVDSSLQTDPLHFLKYMISGKQVLGSLYAIFFTYNVNTDGNTRSLEKDLKREWIPLLSAKYESLLNEIEIKMNKK